MENSGNRSFRRKAILHIGTHKTGTTALQQFFTSNSEVLPSFGLNYPLDLPEGALYANGHHYIGWILAERWKHLRNCGYSDAFVQSFDTRLLDTPADLTLLLSSEGFSLLTDEQVAKLGRILLAFDVKVVFYVRRQDEYLQALYQTTLIHENHGATIEETRNRYPLDYHSLARRWARVFGHANIVVRAYEREQLVNGNIVDDFREVCRAFGHELPPETPSARVNQGFPSHYVELAKRWGADTPDEQEIWDVVQRLAWRLYPQGPGTYWFLKPSECEMLLAEYVMANRSLATEFLRRTDGVLFRDLSISLDDSTWEREFGSPERNLLTFLKDAEKRIYDLEVSVAQLEHKLTA